jgi:TonB family protein
MEETRSREAVAAGGSRDYGALSNLWFSARPVLLIAALIGFSLYTNDAVIEYRMEEYNRSMEALSQSYNSGHALNMLARFELIKQRQNQAEEADETALELKLRSLAAGKLIQGKEREKGLQTKAIEAVIRAVGFVLGKKRSVAEVPSGMARELEVAYFYERSRKYGKAIEVYTRGLEDKGLAPGVTATLLLHRGFCASLLGEYDQAVEDFRRAASLAPGSEEARVALRLSEITIGLRDQVRIARESKDLTPYQAGRRLFLLANYAEAAKSLAKVISDAKADPSQRLESRYLYARAQEELGQDSDAVLTYRSIIQHDPEGAYARKANRRLYVLGKFYSQDEDLAKSALKKIEQYQDFKFINSLKSLEVARLPRSAAAQVREVESALPSDNAVAGLGRLDEVKADDLKGRSASAAPKAGEPEKLAAALKQDVRAVRRAAPKIMADPLRKEAIFATIQDNQGELEFIYQKWLRKGPAFEGGLSIRILIEPSGRVRDAKIVAEKSSVDNSPFVAEILQTVKKWKFREDPGAGADVPVSFPVRFVNKQ